MAYTYTAGALSSVVSSGSVTVDFPASPQNGDIFIAWFAIRSNVGFSTPTDWTKIHESLTGDTDSTQGVASGQAFWFRYTGSGTSQTFSRTGGDRAQGIIIGVRGCVASGDPVDAQSITTSPGSSNTWPNISASSGGDPRALLASIALGDNGTVGNISSTTPSGGTWTEAPMTGDNTGADGGGSVYYHDPGLNAGETTSTIAATSTTAGTHVVSTIALKPSSAQTITGQSVGATANVTVASVVAGAVTVAGTTVAAVAAVTAAAIDAPAPASFFYWRMYQRVRRSALTRM